MTDQPPARSTLNIAVRQNETAALDAIAAYSRRYRTAAHWRRLRTVGTYVLALLAPVLSLARPGQGPLIAAIAAAWLVAGRTALTHVEQSHTARAASLQELFDTDLFGLTWNSALAGRRDRTLEDRVSLAPHRHEDGHQDWYTVDSTTGWPADVLLCQMQNVAWGRRNHKNYVPYLATGGAALLLLALVWSIGRQMSVYDFLILLFLPTAPALLDLGELIFSHRRHSDAKGRVEDDIRDLLARISSGESVAADECRRVQDAVYQLRCTGPRIPGWFYRTQRKTDTMVNEAAVNDLRHQLPNSTAPEPDTNPTGTGYPDTAR